MAGVPDRLRIAIIHAGLAKGEVAERAGMHRQVLTDMLGGRTPGTLHLGKLAPILGVPLEWLVEGVNPPAWLRSQRGALDAVEAAMNSAIEAGGTIRGTAGGGAEMNAAGLRIYEALAAADEHLVNIDLPMPVLVAIVAALVETQARSAEFPLLGNLCSDSLRVLARSLGGDEVASQDRLRAVASSLSEASRKLAKGRARKSGK